MRSRHYGIAGWHVAPHHVVLDGGRRDPRGAGRDLVAGPRALAGRRRRLLPAAPRARCSSAGSGRSSRAAGRRSSTAIRTSSTPSELADYPRTCRGELRLSQGIGARLVHRSGCGRSSAASVRPVRPMSSRRGASDENRLPDHRRPALPAGLLRARARARTATTRGGLRRSAALQGPDAALGARWRYFRTFGFARHARRSRPRARARSCGGRSIARVCERHGVPCEPARRERSGFPRRLRAIGTGRDRVGQLPADLQAAADRAAADAAASTSTARSFRSTAASCRASGCSRTARSGRASRSSSSTSEIDAGELCGQRTFDIRAGRDARRVPAAIEGDRRRSAARGARGDRERAPSPGRRSTSAGARTTRGRTARRCGGFHGHRPPSLVRAATEPLTEDAATAQDVPTTSRSTRGRRRRILDCERHLAGNRATGTTGLLVLRRERPSASTIAATGSRASTAGGTQGILLPHERAWVREDAPGSGSYVSAITDDGVDAYSCRRPAASEGAPAQMKVD